MSEKRVLVCYKLYKRVVSLYSEEEGISDVEALKSCIMKSFSDIMAEYDGDTLLIQVNFEHSMPYTTIFTLFQ